jgi:hydroxyacylglutathione hydrolase
MRLTALRAFTDNYIWMIDDGTSALVVDPGRSEPVERALDEHRLELAGILVTHHHADHTGGVDALRPRLRGPLYGPARETMPEPIERLREGDTARVDALGLAFDVLDVPGHTAGHIAFVAADVDGAGLVFCGDTLFSAGCGRLFEGTPADMHASLAKLVALPDATRVCCAHEYTLSNLAFAAAVEPSNGDIPAHAERFRALRVQDKPTLPSTVGQERRINPFVRTTEDEVVRSALARGAASTDPVDVLAALRTWKNEFR